MDFKLTINANQQLFTAIISYGPHEFLVRPNKINL